MTKYLVWARKREAGAEWFDLPYSPRYRNEAESLIDYYTEQWGSLYEYEVHAKGFYPKATRQPCFVGIND